MPKRLPALTAEHLPSLIESILFVAEEPVEVSLLAQALRRPQAEIEGALAELEQRCMLGGTRVQRTGELVQLVTNPEAGPYVERFLGLESRQRISGAALEALAIIGYKQPLTRAGVEQIRGVNSDAAIASLIARGLIEEVGKAPGPGRPALLGTTMRFLEHFGLSNPKDLPPLASNEMAEALGLHAVDEGDDEDFEDEDLPDEGEDEDAELAEDESEEPVTSA
jgi:segregation and condensation protein B